MRSSYSVAHVSRRESIVEPGSSLGSSAGNVGRAGRLWHQQSGTIVVNSHASQWRAAQFDSRQQQPFHAGCCTWIRSRTGASARTRTLAHTGTLAYTGTSAHTRSGEHGTADRVECGHSP